MRINQSDIKKPALIGRPGRRRRTRRAGKPSTNARVLDELVRLDRETTNLEAYIALYEREALAKAKSMRAAGASVEQLANALHMSTERALAFMAQTDGYRAAELLGDRSEGAAAAVREGSPAAYLNIGKTR